MTESEKFFKNVINAVLSLDIDTHVDSMKRVDKYINEDSSSYIQKAASVFEPRFFGKGSNQGFTVSIIKVDKSLFTSHKYICIVKVDSRYSSNRLYYDKKEHQKDIKLMFDHLVQRNLLLVQRNLLLEESRREEKFKEYNGNLSKFINISQVRDEKINDLLADK